jgi:hypothetical protein
MLNSTSRSQTSSVECIMSRTGHAGSFLAGAGAALALLQSQPAFAQESTVTSMKAAAPAATDAVDGAVNTAVEAVKVISSRFTDQTM